MILVHFLAIVTAWVSATLTTTEPTRRSYVYEPIDGPMDKPRYRYGEMLKILGTMMRRSSEADVKRCMYLKLGSFQAFPL